MAFLQYDKILKNVKKKKLSPPLIRIYITSLLTFLYYFDSLHIIKQKNHKGRGDAGGLKNPPTFPGFPVSVNASYKENEISRLSPFCFYLLCLQSGSREGGGVVS